MGLPGQTSETTLLFLEYHSSPFTSREFLKRIVNRFHWKAIWLWGANQCWRFRWLLLSADYTALARRFWPSTSSFISATVSFTAFVNRKMHLHLAAWLACTAKLDPLLPLSRPPSPLCVPLRRILFFVGVNKSYSQTWNPLYRYCLTITLKFWNVIILLDSLQNTSGNTFCRLRIVW